MSNRSVSPVGYQKFESRAVLSEGLLGVARPGGELESRVAAAFERLAGVAGAIADSDAAFNTAKASEAQALAGAPGAATITGGGPQAYAPGGPLPGPVDPSSLGRKTPAGAQALMQRAMAGGLTKVQAAGLIGNFVQESGLNPTIVGDGGMSVGLGQWNRERLAALKQFGGANWRDPLVQVDFALHELRTSESAAGRKLMAATTVDEATAAVISFERPQGWTADNPRGGHGWNNRLAHAVRLAGTQVDLAVPAAGRSVPRDLAAPGMAVRVGPLPAGAPTGGKSVSGRPLYSDGKGGVYSEKTVTFKVGRKWYTFPSVDENGNIKTENQVAAYVSEKGPIDPVTGENFPAFDSREAAEKYAKERSETRVSESNAAQSPVRISAGTPGTWRPSGRNTIAGRAWDAAGTRTYLQMLDATMRTDIAAVYEASKNDPLELQANLDALRVLHTDPQNGHVFDEIRGDYEAAFARMTQPYLQQAMQDEQRRREDANRAAFLERTSELNTHVARQAAALTPDNPFAAETLAGAQGAIDEHYDSAVRLGLMTAEDAAKAKIASRGATAAAFYARQAEGLDAEGLAGLREQMRADWAAGKLPGLDAGSWNDLDSHFGALEKQKRVEDKQALDALDDRAKAMVDRAKAGIPIDPTEESRLRIDAGSLPGAPQVLERRFAEMAAAREVATLPLPDAQRAVADRRARLTAQSGDAEIAAAEAADKALAAKEKQIANDPLGHAAQRGVITLEPLDFSSADALATSLADRAQDAKAAALHLGTPPVYFRTSEKQALAAAAAKDPLTMPGMASAMLDAFGADTPQALAELTADAPILAHVAGLQAWTGDPALTVEMAEALAARKGDGYKATIAEGKRLQDTAWPLLAPALGHMPKTAAATLETATALTEYRALQRGINAADATKAGDPANTLFLDALDSAAGGRMIGDRKFGGFVEVNGRVTLAPADMAVEDFLALLEGIDNDALLMQPEIVSGNAVAVSPEAIRAGQLIAIGPGQYNVALGDIEAGDPQFVAGADGGRWVLDMTRLQATARMRGDAGARGTGTGNLARQRAWGDVAREMQR